MLLNGKIAVVTGGANGIGKAAAMRFAQEGAGVVIGDIQEAQGAGVAEEIRSNGGRALFVRCDVGLEADVRNLMEEAVKTFGAIHILHNNAGIDYSKPMLEMDEQEWNRVININLTSVFRGCRFAVPHMIASGGGSIVNTSSAQAHRGFLGYSAYSATKGGICAITRQLAVELGPHNIRVNSISPGAIATPMTNQCLAESDRPEELLKEYVSLHIQPRLGLMEEVADAVLFLASDQSSFLTGIDIPVDGGLQAKPPGIGS